MWKLLVLAVSNIAVFGVGWFLSVPSGRHTVSVPSERLTDASVRKHGLGLARSSTLNALRDAFASGDDWSALTGNLGEKDYNRLAHSLYSILDDPQKDQIFATISLYFADQYPEAFITWLLSVPPSPKLHAALEVAVGRLSKRNLEMALTAIQELGDEKQVEIGWNTLCLTICDDDPSAALRYSDGAGYGLSARLKGTIIKEWAKIDPETACSHIVESMSDTYLSSALAEWAKVDLKSAIDWAKSELGRDANGALRLFEGLLWDNDDPRGAAQLASELPKNGYRSGLLRRSAKAWAAKDLSGVLKWADGMKSPLEQAIVREEVANAVAGYDIETSMQINALLPSAIMRGDAIDDYVTKRIQYDPEGTVMWIEETFNEEEQFFRATSTALEEWAKQDYQAARDYVEQMNNDAERQFFLQQAFNQETKSNLN